MSLTNTNLLVTESQGKEAEIDSKNNSKFKNKNNWEDGTTYKAIKSSISDGYYIKTPNLLSFNETYPRFIRGLSWDSGEVYKSTDDEINSLATDLSTYGTSLNESSSYWIHSDQYEKDKDGNFNWDEI